MKNRKKIVEIYTYGRPVQHGRSRPVYGVWNTLCIQTKYIEARRVTLNKLVPVAPIVSHNLHYIDAENKQASRGSCSPPDSRELRIERTFGYAPFQFCPRVDSNRFFFYRWIVSWVRTVFLRCPTGEDFGHPGKNVFKLNKIYSEYI